MSFSFLFMEIGIELDFTLVRDRRCTTEVYTLSPTMSFSLLICTTFHLIVGNRIGAWLVYNFPPDITSGINIRHLRRGEILIEHDCYLVLSFPFRTIFNKICRRCCKIQLLLRQNNVGGARRISHSWVIQKYFLSTWAQASTTGIVGYPPRNKWYGSSQLRALGIDLTASPI